MSLNDLELRSSYDSDEDDILNEFYIPALSESIIYKRLAGFFSSTSFALAARGIANFVVNGGNMKLVVGARLKQSDIDAIRRGVEEPETVITSFLLNEFDLELIEDAFMKDHVRALAWMIAKKKLDIKVAIPVDENNVPLSEKEIEKRGIFHIKVGILEDKEGHMLSFSGSVNESAFGWKENIEEFKIFRNWNVGEAEYLQSDNNKFDKFWTAQAQNVKILTLPEIVKQKLIEIAPENFNELKIIHNKRKKEIKLYPIQEECVQNWFKNNKKGIFELATGVGKTYTALGCLKRLEEETDSLGVVIACPYQHLINEPWKKSINDFGFDDTTILLAYGTVNSWVKNLANEILNLNAGISNKLIVITTYKTFSSEKFTQLINRIEKPLLLIADELHNVGSVERKKGLLKNYKFRIGLSATPSRWFDEEGTKIIFDYFEKTVHKFSLRDAIKTINPRTGKTYLTPYEYKPIFVEMTERELYEYEKISKKISRSYYFSKNSEDKNKLFEFLLFQRSKIIKNAENKILEFEKLVDTLIEQYGGVENIKHCLVYCAQKKGGEMNQMTLVKDILDKRGIVNHRFTQTESYEERRELLEKFAANKYQTLIAIKCLDEGVDVPPTKIGILIASTKNPIEAIQRRGRVLRRFPGKEKAIIYDFIVVPSSESKISEELFDLECKILKSEFERVKEFANDSMNKLEVLNVLIPIARKYNISLK